MTARKPAQRSLLSTTLLLFAACAAPHADSGIAQERPPNLLVIQTDEHNFRTLGCYRETLSHEQAFVWGDEAVVTTPHIDSLAREGALCTSFYATSPVCSPSRAAFVSGRYPQNTPVVGNDVPLADEIVTFAEILRRRGYATGYAGKWHLDGKGKPQWAPERKFGFEDNRYLFNRGHWKQLEITEEGPRVKARNEKGKPTYKVAGADEESFATDFLADRTLEFIAEHADEPFCFMVSFPDPHGPDSVRPPYDTLFADQKGAKPRTFGVKKEDAPGWAKPQGKFQPMAKYLGMVKCIDDNVGRILDALREHDLLDDTIVVFTSDHGDLRGEHHRQNKGVPFEASAKIPFVVRAPDRIAAGTVIDEALGCVDFLPTILALMEVPRAGLEEGRDASALLRTGSAPDDWLDVAFLRQAGKQRDGWLAAVTDRHKLVVAPECEPWLFDLERDPDELTNFFSDPSYRATASTLASLLLEYATEHADPYADHPEVRAQLVEIANL